MSSGFGSSTEASFCAARKIFLSLASACSSARVDDHERHHHVREHHDVPQGNDGESFVDFHGRFGIRTGAFGKLTRTPDCGIRGDGGIERSGRAGERGRPVHVRPPVIQAGRPTGDLPGLLDERNRLVLGLDVLAGDDHFPRLLLLRQVVHQLEHHVFDDHPQAAGTDLPLQG